MRVGKCVVMVNLVIRGKMNSNRFLGYMGSFQENFQVKQPKVLFSKGTSIEGS